jgi:Fe-S-cluster containining protein
MKCRPACGACCIALSISSPIPGLPDGKPEGVRCIHLTDEFQCGLFGLKERPAVCSALQPSDDLCGVDREDAVTKIAWLEENTRPALSRNIKTGGAAN